MSSLVANFPFPYLGVYSSTKASLTSLFTSMYFELKREYPKVKLSIIEPGCYHTGFNQKMISEIGDPSVSLFIGKVFNMIEKQNLASIVIKIVVAIETDDPKRVYRAPLDQSLMVKILKLIV